MSLQPDAMPVVAGAELLERALSFTRGALALVTPERLGVPTPCTRWDLRQLLEHMDDSLAALHEAAALGRVATNPELPPETADEPSVVTSLRRRGCSLLGSWSRLDRDQPVAVGAYWAAASTVALAGALEVAVHGWDVARACGDLRPLPEGLAAALLPGVGTVISAGDRGVRFAPPVPVDPTRPAGERLLASTGRPPDWSP